jgi:hypothetical protein
MADDHYETLLANYRNAWAACAESWFRLGRASHMLPSCRFWEAANAHEKLSY